MTSRPQTLTMELKINKDSVEHNRLKRPPTTGFQGVFFILKSEFGKKNSLILNNNFIQRQSKCVKTDLKVIEDPVEAGS